MGDWAWVTLFLCSLNETAAFSGMASRVQGIPSPAEKSTRNVTREPSCAILMALSLVPLSPPGDTSLQASQPGPAPVRIFPAPAEILLFQAPLLPSDLHILSLDMLIPSQRRYLGQPLSLFQGILSLYPDQRWRP